MDPLPNGVTSAIVEFLSDHIWSWDDFLLFHYAV
jgi:hypothetical protein